MITMENPTMTETLEKKLDKIVKKACKRYRVKAASIAIVSHDDTLYENHYGVIDGEKTPNDEKKKMMIGSNTKMLTALAILKLKDEEKLDLDLDVRHYLPDFSVRSRFGEQEITVRDLLMHCSGLPCDDYTLITDANKDLSDVLPVLSDAHMIAKPKTMPAYSNLGYGLLGLIIEAVSDKSYTDYITENINKPLGLSVEFITDEKMITDRNDIALSFDVKGNTRIDPLSSILSAGSNTYATLSDMKKLLWYFLNPETQQLLEKETFESMISRPDNDFLLDEEYVSGLGLRHGYMRFYNHEETGPVIGHGGNTIYHHSTFDFLPELRLGFTIMTNSRLGNVAANKMRQKMMVAVLEAQGIAMPKKQKPTCETTRTEKKIPAESYVMTGMKLPVKRNLFKKTVFKTSFLKFTLKPCDDGFFQAHPKGLSRLPFLSSMVRSLRLRPETVAEHDVLYMEQNGKYAKATAAVAAKYQEPQVNESWKEALGKYNIKESGSPLAKLFSGPELKMSGEDLILQLKVFGQSAKYYLLVLDKNHAIVQGYGRNARETVYLLKDNNDYCQITLQGVRFEKRTLDNLA